MNKNDLSKALLRRVTLLGVMAGMRSVSAPAMMIRRAARQPQGFKGTVFSPLSSESVSKLATLASLGEMVADKLPILPARISPLPLLGRIFWGGFSGAMAATEAKREAMPGTAVGAVSAVASAYTFYFLRTRLSKLLRVPDFVVAVAEDSLVFRFGRAVSESY